MEVLAGRHRGLVTSWSDLSCKLTKPPTGSVVLLSGKVRAVRSLIEKIESSLLVIVILGESIVGVAMIRHLSVTSWLAWPDQCSAMTVVVPPPPPPWSDIFPRPAVTCDLHYLIINAPAAIPLTDRPTTASGLWLCRPSPSPLVTNTKTMWSHHLKASQGCVWISCYWR